VGYSGPNLLGSRGSDQVSVMKVSKKAKAAKNGMAIMKALDSADNLKTTSTVSINITINRPTDIFGASGVR
jgi:hypothetical protein